MSRWRKTQGPECWLVYRQSWSPRSRACGLFLVSIFLLLAFQRQLNLWTLLNEGGCLLFSISEVEKKSAMVVTSFTFPEVCLGTLTSNTCDRSLCLCIPLLPYQTPPFHTAFCVAKGLLRVRSS